MTVPSFAQWLAEAADPYPYRVDYWSRRRGYSSVRQRKFRTRDDAFTFVSQKDDDGYDCQTFYRDENGKMIGTTWNGSSRS